MAVFLKKIDDFFFILHCLFNTFLETLKLLEMMLKLIFSTYFQITSEIGVCKPLTNLYDDLLVKDLCAHSIASLVSYCKDI